MSAPYTVPKREVSASVLLPEGEPMELRIFLNERAETHSGYERPSDLLDGPHSFIPAIDGGDHLVLLNRDSLMVLTVAAEHEFGGDDPVEIAYEQTTRAQVEVILESGATLRGLLTYLQPEAQRRLQDFLNREDRFIAIRDGALVRLVNKRRIARVRPV